MNILYVISSTELGGAEKVLADLAIYMAKKHHIQIVSLKPLGQIAAQLQAQQIPVITLANQPAKIRALRQLIAREKPDIVHAMLFRAIEYSRLACAGQPVCLITTPHFDMAKRPWLYRLADRVLKNIDTLTVVESAYTAAYLTEHQKYNKNKLVVLPNSVDKNVFFKDEKLRISMREQMKFSRENCVFISVSRLSPQKDPLCLLQAFRNVHRVHPTSRLVLVGEGSERALLTNFINESKLQDAVFLVGEQQNINAWLNMADVFMLMSKEESLPLALLEALCVGLPCIVSKAGDMPLYISHGKNGYVCQSGDIVLLSCLMTQLLQDPALRSKMGTFSLEKSSAMQDVSPQYQQLYQQLYTSFHVKT